MTCTHHFIIETPNGGETVKARCRKCGKTREYMVSWEARYNNAPLKREA